MNAEFYLIFRVRKNRYRGLSVRLAERKPTLALGEIAIRTAVRLPEALFERPALTATIAIPSSEVPSSEIPAQMQDNIAAAIKAQLGYDVTLKIEAGK